MPQHLAGAGRGVSGSHVRRKRDGAATELFLQLGYDRTPLARVAQSAGVSRATLFKQFPTKAELFEAAVLAAGDVSDDDVQTRQRETCAPVWSPWAWPTHGYWPTLG